MDLIDRYCGCLLGLAVGAALGTTLEFRPLGTFAPSNDMIGGALRVEVSIPRSACSNPMLGN